ncbi:ribosome-associated protein [Nocardioides daedukensis]|uniref:Ribosome-associated protein n=1 Tax=Nocardioides daedukensis TaxID=634462 RepID=A0A7Y9S5Q4_9ACTN|nr:RNA-binding S4 domain-containing protein [Nocardioides daedukensis]NYG60533.1 ribosome-associated protein [Nocardioides daedukensis]
MSTDVPIRDESIRLGQFLKLANLVEDGAEAKAVIGQGLVSVNGEVDTRRGRQLVLGDVVALGGVSVRVAVEDPNADDGLPW